MLKIFKRVTISVLIVFILLSITFYLLVGVGLSSKLQTLWVTTAMTTMNHKWLATSIISEEKINDIMSNEYVDDSNFNTVIEELLVPNVGDYLLYSEFEYIKENSYEYNGYQKLEEGIYLKDVQGTGWRGYIMLVSNPLDVSLAETPKQGVTGTTVKKMVENTGAVAGINGGGFNDGPNYDSNGGSVSGLLIIDGKLINPNYNDNNYEYNMIGFNSQGKLILRHCTADWAMQNDIQNAVSFSPFLIVNGEGTIKQGTGGWGIAPRTALGQRETGEVLFLVVDGRQPTWSIGVDIKVLQDILLDEKCVNAAMMDGGSSTVMVYNNEFVNKPSLGHERYINNAWVINKIK